MLPGPEDGLEEMGPEEAVEELLARMLEYRRYSDAAEGWPSASRPSAATSTARRRCRPSCGGSRSTPPPPSTTPTCSAPRSATC